MPTQLVILGTFDDAQVEQQRRTSAMVDVVIPAVENFVKRAEQDNTTDNRVELMEDISTSPRLIGYAFCCISSAVGLTSSLAFFIRSMASSNVEIFDEFLVESNIYLSNGTLESIETRVDRWSKRYHLYLGSGGSIVRSWKLYGSIIISGVITVVTLGILLAHFDSSRLCVQQNTIFFGDGSTSERNIIVFLIALSLAAVYIQTTQFSVGEAQANVYFSTWTNLLSILTTFEVWKKGSNNSSLAVQSALLGKHRFWYALAIFSTITLLSTIEFLWNGLRVEGELKSHCVKLGWANKWVFFTVAGAVCPWSIIFLQRHLTSPVLSILKATVLGTMIGFTGYATSEFTSGTFDMIACPSNLYFSIWIQFFLSVWIFASMLQGSWG